MNSFAQSFIKAALDNNVLQFGDFTLKSGRKSPYFFNAGKLATSDALCVLADGYADILAKNTSKNTPFVLFGAAYKGIPFVAATAYALYKNHGINASWGYNRKEAKDHGEGGVLVGASLRGQDVWIVDDVMTAGTAIKQVVSLIEAEGGRVKGVVIALDRKECANNGQSALQELKKALDIPIIALADIDDIVQYVKAQNSDDYLKIKAYRDTYGVE